MFFSIKSESIRVDYLARQEKLLEDFSLIQDILGLDSLKFRKLMNPQYGELILMM
jgi:hypothetical protein